MYNTLNYNEGGDKTVIGGTLEIMEGATVIIHEGANIVDERPESAFPPVIDIEPEQNVGAAAPDSGNLNPAPDSDAEAVDVAALARELQELKDKLQAIKDIIG